MGFVIDASVIGSWCFPDENDAISEAAWNRLAAEDAFVPAIWWFEVRNILVVNERRGRIDAPGTNQFLADLARLPIRIDRSPESDAVLLLARAHRLSAYDAAYLELARRLSCPLATLDRSLSSAATNERVPLIAAWMH